MIKSICILEDTLYYSEAWIGTLLLYLKVTDNNCDQAQIQFNDDQQCRIIGDLAIEKSLPEIKNIIGNNIEIEFIKFSDKCLCNKVKKIVNVIISSPIYDSVPFKVEEI